MKDLLHTLQENGRDPVCIFSCCTRLLLCENDLLHTLQEKVCDPVCMSICLAQCDFMMNDLLHTQQENGRNLRNAVCIFSC